MGESGEWEDGERSCRSGNTEGGQRSTHHAAHMLSWQEGSAAAAQAALHATAPFLAQDSGRRGAAVVSTVPSQQEGRRFDSNLPVWSLHVLPAWVHPLFTPPSAFLLPPETDSSCGATRNQNRVAKQ